MDYLNLLLFFSFEITRLYAYIVFEEKKTNDRINKYRNKPSKEEKKTHARL